MGENSTANITPSVVLTGTAREGTPGPPIGHVDIGVSESAYLFRVALPGVRKDQCKFHVCVRLSRLSIHGSFEKFGMESNQFLCIVAIICSSCRPLALDTNYITCGRKA